LEINLESFIIERTYIRNGKNCFFDQIRQILVIATPEEYVRQKLICFLLNILKVPLDKIGVEVPLAHFKRGEKSRADLVIYGNYDEDNLMPVMVIECKAPEVFLTDTVYEQVRHYNEILCSDTIAITNGSELLIWSWDEKQKEFLPLLALPKYIDLVIKQNLLFDYEEQPVWERPKFSEIFGGEVANEFIEQGWIGEGIDKTLYPFIINLAGFLLDDTKKLPPQVLNGINIIEDGGIRYTSFGNAAGGRWPGYYRYFIIEDGEKNNQIISLAIMGGIKCENHPKFRNSPGYTVFIVAIDDFDKSHNSLQLNIDNYTFRQENTVAIWHDGRLAVGNLGAVKKNEVLDFVKKKAPELIDESGKVLLGSFNNLEEITWETPEAKEFLGRIVKYALLRDEFRESVKSVKNT
jgi:hypothetical protein